MVYVLLALVEHCSFYDYYYEVKPLLVKHYIAIDFILYTYVII